MNDKALPRFGSNIFDFIGAGGGAAAAAVDKRDGLKAKSSPARSTKMHFHPFFPFKKKSFNSFAAHFVVKQTVECFLFGWILSISYQ